MVRAVLRAPSGPSRRDEILWDIDEHATLFIEPSAEHAGAGRITLAVTGLDALLERLAAESVEHGPIETYANGVRHVNVPDTSRCATRCSCAPCRSARLGRPVVAMPVGMHDGLPFGAQVIARPFAEAVALTVAAACESHTRLGVLSVHMTR